MPALPFGGGRTTRGAGSDGFTLIEVLLVVAIAGVVLVPLMAWSVLVVTQQDDLDNNLQRASATGFVNSFLTRDVASSKYVKDGGAACGGDVVGSLPRLQLIPAGVDRRIVYVEAPSSDPEGPIVRSLWRTECDSNGAIRDAGEIVRGIKPGSVTAGCFSTTGMGACDRDASRQVQLSVVPLRADGSDAPAIQVRALRRTSSASTGTPASANRHPVAQLTISPPTGYGSTMIKVSASDSFDVDGTIASYDWTFPSGAVCAASDGGATQSCTFSTVGDHLVQVVVTDDRGATNLSTGTVTVLNQFPIAVASVSPSSGTVGTTSFAFDGSTSIDPDGGPVSYRWDLGDDLGADRYLTGPNPTYRFPAAAATGLRQITLVVTDANGDNDATMFVIDLSGSTTSPGGGSVVGDVIVSPALVSSGPGLPRISDPVGPGLPVRTINFASSAPLPEGATASWDLRRHGMSTVVASGTGAAFSYGFGDGSAGSYDVVLTVTTPGGSPVASAPASFRVNAAPVANFTSAGGGTAPVNVSFSASGSSDPDGSIVSYRWNFGFFDQWSSSNPAPVWTFNEPGTFTVTLDVTDSDGATSRMTRTITIAGTPHYPSNVTLDGGTLKWAAVAGASSYRVSLVYHCGTPQYTVAATANPSFTVTPPSAVCGTSGTVDAYVETEVNRTYSSMSGVVRLSG